MYADKSTVNQVFCVVGLMYISPSAFVEQPPGLLKLDNLTIAVVSFKVKIPVTVASPDHPEEA